MRISPVVEALSIQTMSAEVNLPDDSRFLAYSVTFSGVVVTPLILIWPGAMSMPEKVVAGVKPASGL